MRLRALSIGIVLFALSGCATINEVKRVAQDRLGLNGPTGPDAVFIEYAVIERPAGSTAIDHDVWANIDEQILPLETRALLSQNALRVGVIGGLLPSELETMLANPKSTVGLRQRRLYVNNPALVTMDGPVPHAEYQIQRAIDDVPTTIKFEQAKFSISMTPTHGPDGRITLKCVPEMEYQDKKYWLPTGAVGANWLANRPCERYDSMSWEMTLSPREYMIIGTQNERSNWLGNQTFGGQQGNEKVQRMLIVRAGRLTPAETGSDPSTAAPGKDGVVPIASQASISVRARTASLNVAG